MEIIDYMVEWNEKCLEKMKGYCEDLLNAKTLDEFKDTKRYMDSFIGHMVDKKYNPEGNLRNLVKIKAKDVCRIGDGKLGFLKNKRNRNRIRRSKKNMKMEIKLKS